MELNLRLVRAWELGDHLRHLHEGEWLPMLDPDGNVFAGIQGKPGVRGHKADGTHIGADFIRMQPGSRFPLHTHTGDHEIYFIDGSGYVHIDGKDIPVGAGHLIHIPAEYPHGVWVAREAIHPLVFAAVGHPHEHVNAKERMNYKCLQSNARWTRRI